MLSQRKTLSEEELLQAIVEIIRKQLGDCVQKIFLFGSRARKDYINPRTDIDIGYICDKKPDIRAKFIIEEKIENLHTLLKIDVVDLEDAGDSLRKEALKDMKVLYEKK